jgi:hypothetical protein
MRIGDEAVPWNASAVVVHARISLPPSLAWDNSDFSLEAAGLSPLSASSIEPSEEEDVFNVRFRCSAFQKPLLVTALCKGRILGQLNIPFLTADAFLQSLHIESATVFASLDSHEIACKIVVEGQSSPLTATAILRSPHSLLPLVDFEIAAEFVDQVTHRERVIRLQLDGAQLQGKQASLCATITQSDNVSFQLLGRWRIENRILAHCTIRTISLKHFHESIYLAKSWYSYQKPSSPQDRPLHVSSPSLACFPRACFLLASREPGTAGTCPLELHVNFWQPGRPPLVLRQEMALMDRPSILSPEIAAKGHDIRSFELFLSGRRVGVIPVGFVPTASFTNEGGFRAPESFAWSAWAEEEMADRLGMLMGSVNPSAQP